MPSYALFPTYVQSGPLQPRSAADFNRQLLAESRQLRADDRAGRAWSAKKYPGGYTSYGSVNQLQRLSPTFASLQKKLQRHVRRFAATAQWDLAGRQLTMTDCWVNIMTRHVTHGLHLHPLSTLSGTYYVQVPRGSPGIKFEDPRLDRFMASPPRSAGARLEDRPWVTLPAIAGHVVLFESWLRHEVVANPVAAERVSISFNYDWLPAP
jgi:uncharacterized protein (TIGR02466 family)